MKLRRRKMRARVEMTPLMDVVFLLLVFFIYSMMSMAVHRALPLNLPTSSQAEIERDLNLSLSITADGALFLDKEPVSPDGLVAALVAKRTQSGANEITLQVFADGSLNYRELYQVLDLIKAAGVSKVTLQAKSESSAP